MPELLQEMYYGPNVQNLIESDDCKVMRLSDNSGEGMMTLYHVFPGVFLISWIRSYTSAQPLKARCCAISFRSVRPKSTLRSSTNMTYWKRWPRP